MTAVPNRAKRLLTKTRRKSSQRLRVSTRGAATASCWICASAISVPHPGVEHRVKDVHQEVHEHEEQGAVKDYALDHSVVPAIDGLVGDLANPRPGEDRLGYDRAAHEETHLQSDDRHRWEHGVPQGVLEDHAPRDDSLGTGRAHVVLAHYLKHAAARHARDHGHRDSP